MQVISIGLFNCAASSILETCSYLPWHCGQIGEVEIFQFEKRELQKFSQGGRKVLVRAGSAEVGSGPVATLVDESQYHT